MCFVVLYSAVFYSVSKASAAGGRAMGLPGISIDKKNKHINKLYEKENVSGTVYIVVRGYRLLAHFTIVHIITYYI